MDTSQVREPLSQDGNFPKQAFKDKLNIEFQQNLESLDYFDPKILLQEFMLRK